MGGPPLVVAAGSCCLAAEGVIGSGVDTVTRPAKQEVHVPDQCVDLSECEGVRGGIVSGQTHGGDLFETVVNDVVKLSERNRHEALSLSCRTVMR